MNRLSCDLLVIGAGSGGVAAALRAAKHGAKCIVANYVQPSPMGTSWGIGGTCVNVGCIPKKLMHIAAMKSEQSSALEHFGWGSFHAAKTFRWEILQENVTNYIRSLNFKINSAFAQADIQSLNALASFESRAGGEALLEEGSKTNPTPVFCENALTKEQWKVSARNVIIATGGRPRFPDIPGAREFGMTSDDIFWSKTDPGHVVIIGAGYIAFEFAGFLGRFAASMGRPKPIILIRSKPLGIFDADAVMKVVEDITHIVDVIYDAPTTVAKSPANASKRLTVRTKNGRVLLVDNVIFAVGRDPETQALGLQKAGVEVEPRTGKIIVQKSGETSAKGIFALGDIIENAVELTPMAVYEGRHIADHLFRKDIRKGLHAKLTDSVKAFAYDPKLVATTIFTPLEYGRIGYTEAEALAKFGGQNIKVYHTAVQTLENAFLMQFPEVRPQSCYLKVVVRKIKVTTDSAIQERVIGWHLVSPNAGEITQGIALAMLKGLTMEDIDHVIGIHPTTAECITSLQDKADFPVAELPSC